MSAMRNRTIELLMVDNPSFYDAVSPSFFRHSIRKAFRSTRRETQFGGKKFVSRQFVGELRVAEWPRYEKSFGGQLTQGSKRGEIRTGWRFFLSYRFTNPTRKF